RRVLSFLSGNCLSRGLFVKLPRTLRYKISLFLCLFLDR
ncbi:hypothetical protein Goklo_027786, partial [Gossypium klotzschianum]|nr:hypothetical protein [Gossypium klotzschianum]